MLRRFRTARRAGGAALLLQVLRAQDDVGEQPDGVALPAASGWPGEGSPRALRRRREDDLCLQILRAQIYFHRLAHLVQMPAPPERRGERPSRAGAVEAICLS